MNKTDSIDIIEGRARRMCEGFAGVPDTVPAWRVREIGVRAAMALHLPAAAREYLGELLALIPDRAWREGFPLAFRSITAAAVDRGADERQIHRYEVAIIRAGFAYREAKHARRRSGVGGNGLNFGPLAVQLETFAGLADRLEDRRRDHSQARAAHRAAVASVRCGIEEAHALPSLRALALEISAALDAVALVRIGARVTVSTIRAAVAAIEGLRARLREALSDVDNIENNKEMSVNSDKIGVHKDSTNKPLPLKGTCRRNVDNESASAHAVSGALRANAEKKGCGAAGPDQGKSRPCPVPKVSIKAVLRAASDDLRAVFSRSGERDDWRALASSAVVMLPALGIHPSAWREAVACMGEAEAAACVVAIDRKHRLEPDDRRYVSSPGGYLRGMARRSRQGVLAIERSIYGLAGDASA